MELTPKQIVEQLDRYIIGQEKAKKAVAIALRNRYRRAVLPKEIRAEITPKNIIMKGPTGVGKTEIARRLAMLVNAPFVKVEATKFTEVGYVGRDVESMVRDLVEVSMRLVKDEKIAEMKPKAQGLAEKKLVEALFPARKKNYQDKSDAEIREQLLEELKDGKLDHINLELEIPVQPKGLQLGPLGGNDTNISEFMSKMLPKQIKKRRMSVAEALKFFTEEEADKLIDEETITQEALTRAEEHGIIFIDELDKIASKGSFSGPDVSREGVQRDILPIVEGSSVSTKYGNVKTDYMLFIAAGAFHISKVSDLIPELQGRFPIHVELNSLTEDDFFKILKEPDNAITLQYKHLLKVDKINLTFTDDALKEIAKLAYWENINRENIGARRLHAIMEMLLEEVSYNAGSLAEEIDLVIDYDFVVKNTDKSLKEQNLKKYII
ncbi:MAG: ATP-dependent protease ATPase subunit HslU [Christensenellales bacterium]|jgi:ATP-dependent HslUV protease ATP-binding subunit HslU|nr:ATP-dependent protease ATPase subunit HslU [Clostridiales bacterium]